eukprot:Gb_21711 [translate_table: standard]
MCLLWVLFVGIALPVLVNAKSTIEPCSGFDTCTSMLAYHLPTDLKLSEVATRFQVDPVYLLGANAFDISYPDAENQIIPARYMLKVPITCQCVNGIRKSASTTYRVRAADTIFSIANSVFGKLVTSAQIKDANHIADSDIVDIGQLLAIPLPCGCFNGTDNGLPAVYLAYVVQPGDNLLSIAREYQTTVTDLMTVNALGSSVIAPADILEVILFNIWNRPSVGITKNQLVLTSYAFSQSNLFHSSFDPSRILWHISLSRGGKGISSVHPKLKRLTLFTPVSSLHYDPYSDWSPSASSRRDDRRFSPSQPRFKQLVPSFDPSRPLMACVRVLDLALKIVTAVLLMSAACSSNISKYASDSNLLVANGSYAITASHCLQCSCGPMDLELYCAPAPLDSSCSSMQCKNSDLTVGNVTAQPTSAGCNVTACSYSGYVNGTIVTSLSKSLQPRCPGTHVLPTLTRPPSTLEAPSPSVLSPNKSPTKSPTKSPSAQTSGATGVSPANGPSGQASMAPDLHTWFSLTSMLMLGLPFFIRCGDW